VARIKEIDERVVDIRVRLENGLERRGSGYLVGPGRVLTALHVIIGDNLEDLVTSNSPIVAPSQIDVRALGDLLDLGDYAGVAPSNTAAQFEAAGAPQLWRSAKLLWPKTGTKIPRFELALIDVADHHGLRVLPARVPLIVSSAEDGEEVRALGFPSWFEIKSKDASILIEPHTVRARVSKTPSVHLSSTEAVVISGAPADHKEWKGLSGAALFRASGELIGVFSSVHNSVGNDLLRVTMLSAFGEDDKFSDFWPLTALWNPAASALRKLPDFTRVRPGGSEDVETRRYVQTLFSLWIEDYYRDLLDKDAPWPLQGYLVNRERPSTADLAAKQFSKASETSERDLIRDFSQAQRRLLILGAAGSGKSICALRIVEYLCWRFSIAGLSTEVIPIPLTLSNWVPSNTPLRDWLCREFQRVHKSPEYLCDRWLADRKVIPVLDGLDEATEFERFVYVDAINVFIVDNDPPGLIVCSRWNSGEDWINKLDFDFALRLSATKLSAVTHYLNSKKDLNKLSEQIASEPLLQDIVTTPLIFRVLIRAYRNSDSIYFPADKTGGRFQQEIWTLDVNSMMAWEDKKTDTISSKKTLRALRSLASLMKITDQAVVQIERLQPAALTRKTAIALYAVSSRTLSILLCAILTGVAAGVGIPLGATLGLRNLSAPLFSLQKLYDDVYKSVIIGIMTGVLIGMIDGLHLLTNKDAPPSRVTFVSAAKRVSILLAVTLPPCLAWLSWSGVGTDRFGVDNVLLICLWTCFLFGIRGARQTRRYDIVSGEFFEGSMEGAVKGLFAGFWIGVAFFIVYDSFLYALIYFTGILLCGALWGGLTARGPTAAEIRAVGPNLWIRNALLAFALFGLGVAAAVTAVGWIGSGFSDRADHSFLVWLAIGGLRKVTWHVLRHTFATQLTLKNVPLTVVKELLGHSSITTTMRYSHVPPSTLRSAIEMLNPKNACIAEFGQPAGNEAPLSHRKGLNSSWNLCAGRDSNQIKSR
jgi:hypothetical protein